MYIHLNYRNIFYRIFAIKHEFYVNFNNLQGFTFKTLIYKEKINKITRTKKLLKLMKKKKRNNKKKLNTKI